MLLQSFVDAVPLGLLIVEPDGRIAAANRAAEALFGHDDGDLAGRAIDTLVPESLRSAHGAHRSAYGEAPSTRAMGAVRDLRALRRDGTEFLAQISISPWRTGAGTRVVACVLDITEQRRAGEEKLAEQRAAAEAGELSRTIVRDTPLGILMYEGASGACVSANAAAARITGLTVEELRQQRFREIAWWRQTGMLTAAETALEHGQPVSRDAQFESGSGKAMAVSCRFQVVPVRGLPHLVLMLDDLTERRDLEAQLRAAQKMEAVGELAGGVAHDFNNLLTVIGTYTTLLIESFDVADPRRDDLLEIMGAATRAATLTRQLLAFGRRQLLDARVLDLNEVVAGLENMLRRVIVSEVELEIVREKGLGKVYADAGQLEQVLMNLVMNARDAMPQGGTLTITTRNVDAPAPADASGDAQSAATGATAAQTVPMVLLSVADTGVGMDERTLSRVFEPFFTTKTAGRGSGLGLSTTYGIVRQSGGHVRVRSAEGSGTTFEVFLPRVAAGPEAVGRADGAVADGAGGTQPERSLIVVAEDDDSVRRIVVTTLRKAGYEVMAAANGQEALAMALGDGKEPALLLTDVVMPAIGGRALAEAMRRRWPGLPVLFASAYATDATTGEAVSDLPGDLLRKPFVPGELVAAVRGAILRGRA